MTWAAAVAAVLEWAAAKADETDASWGGPIDGDWLRSLAADLPEQGA